jgi:uncharacterized protein YdeI (YjbR/CyaY-like superfamily)
MAKSTAKSFQAALERMGSRLSWVIARVPFDVRETWGAGGRPKVKGEINGFQFRTSLFPRRAGGHFLLVNKRMQRGAKVTAGIKAKFRLELDTEERVAAVPAELKRIFAQERALGRWFDKLTYSTRKWIADWISEVKSAEARARRAEQVSEQLMATMEAERDLPPILQVAFARDPQARQGWELMSAAQRRGQLIAIFYYRSPEARARRVEKTVEAAAEVAEKKANRQNPAQED